MDVVAEDNFNLNLPVRMAADSTSIEEPEETILVSSDTIVDMEDIPIAQSSMDTMALSPSADTPEVAPSEEDTAVLLPSQSLSSPAPSLEDSKDSPMTEETVEDLESSSSMNIVIMPECSSPVKDDLFDESSAMALETVVCQDSISLNSNSETAETNIVSSSLQNDLSCLPAECLDSESSSLQPPFNVSFLFFCSYKLFSN